MYTHENDKIKIPEYILNMSSNEIQKEKNRILTELKKETAADLNRYFFSVDEGYNTKIINMLGNIYFNDGTADEPDCYRHAEWCGMEFDLNEVKTLIENDTFYDYLDENVDYLGNLTEEDAMYACSIYYSGTPGTELHISELTNDTPCGNYWF